MTMLRISYPKQAGNGKVEIAEIKAEVEAPAQNGNSEGYEKSKPIEETKVDTISVESL